jgi:hypothetical protein
MTDLQATISKLECKAAEYRMLAELAADPDARLLNRQLSDELTALAKRARERAKANASREPKPAAA